MLPKYNSLCLQFVRMCHVKLHIVFMWFFSLLLLCFISFTFWFLVYLKNVSFYSFVIPLYIVLFWTFNGNALWHFTFTMFRCFFNLCIHVQARSQQLYLYHQHQAFTQRHSCVFLHLKIVVSSLVMFILPLYCYLCILCSIKHF